MTGAFCCNTGNPLQRLPESASERAGHAAVRRLLSERRSRRRRSLSAEQRHYRDQTSQQHVHVSRKSRSQTHLSRLTVRARSNTAVTYGRM